MDVLKWLMTETNFSNTDFKLFFFMRVNEIYDVTNKVKIPRIISFINQ